MLAKTSSILFFLFLAIILYFVYDWLTIPAGVSPKGNSSEMVATISLVSAVVLLLTAIVGLIQKLIELQISQNNLNNKSEGNKQDDQEDK